MALANNRMAKTPERAEEFLVQLSNELKPKAEQELALLRQEKSSFDSDPQVYPWDRPFLERLIQNKQYFISYPSLNHGRTRMHWESKLHQYFNLKYCLEGLNIICHNLFAVTLEDIPMDEVRSPYSQFTSKPREKVGIHM